MTNVSPEAVTLDTLRLLRETLEHLRRLPVVPMTHALCRKIEAHLAAPKVATAQRLAEQAEAEASFARGWRIARSYGPAGNVLAEVIASPYEVSYRIPELSARAARDPKVLTMLQRGETLKFDR